MTDHRFYHIRAALEKPSECSGCALEKLSTGFLMPEGTGVSRLLILGEGGGANEAKDGLPFRPYAQAGAVLERVFKRVGTTREAHVTANVCNCTPPNNELSGAPYELGAALHCRVHLRRIIEQYKPKAILALGAVALRSLTGMTGKKQALENLRGFALSSPEFPGLPIIASYHPSFIARGASHVFPVLCKDLRYAMDIAKNGFNPPEMDFYEHAGPSEMQWIVNECSTGEQAGTLPISVDFETEVNLNVFEDVQLMSALEDLYGDEAGSKKRKEKIGTNQAITQINISIYENQSFVFDASPENMRLTRELLSLPNPKLTYNGWCFDEPVATFNDLPFVWPHIDLMWAFHHLWPDLPGKRGKVAGELEGSLANLQFAASMYGWHEPWKHLVSERPEYYGCHDSASVLMLYYRLQTDMEKMRYGTNGPSVWDGFISMVYEVQPILAGMKARGLPVNKSKMLAFLKSVVLRQRDVNELIQKDVPDDLRVAHPKLGYKKPEKPSAECEECNGTGEIADDTCTICNGLGKIPDDAVIKRAFKLEAEYKRCKCNKIRKKDIEKWQAVKGAVWEPRDPKKPDADMRLRAPDLDCPECYGSGWFNLPERVEERWCKLLPFNVASVPQMKSYAAYRHHRVPKNSKGEYAMDKENVLKLAKKTGDPLYRHTISYREFDKMRVYALGWMPGEDERIHPTTGFFPATGQFSMTDPNAQTAPNIGKYGRLAIEFRSAIEAKPGHVLMEFDKKSYHAQTLGFEAGCMDYIRLAKIDIHSYLAARMCKLNHSEYCLEWSNDELRDWLKWHRKNYTHKGVAFQVIRDKQAKPGILGYGFGLGAGKLYRLNEDSFDNESEARHVLETLDDTFPKVKQYRDRIPLVAKRHGGKLVSRYGFVRWFWDIQKWDFIKREWGHGEDWERCIAYLPANDAFGDMRSIMKRMEVNGMNERYGMILNVHDALVFEVPVQLREEALVEIKAEMEKPSEVLLFEDGTGLQVEVEAKVSGDWSSLKEV